MILSAAAPLSVAPTHLDPIALFLNADIVVQLVIAGLALASVWVWTIIVSFGLRVRSLQGKTELFETDFWDADDPARLVAKRKDTPSARVAAAGLAELDKSTRAGLRDREGARARIALAMEGQVAGEADGLASHLNFLATTGSVAPFVGLFGTVWGIMNSFFQIGQQQNSSLAVVAPGISEALFATAVGLFAAIPAVIAYNRFSHRVDKFEAHLHRFADQVHAQIGRELERG